MRTITLIKPIPFNGKMLDSLTLREPGLREYAALGEPIVQTRSADGAWVVVENSDTIIEYMRALVPADLRGALDHAGLADVLRLKEEVLGFFGDARAAGQTSAQDSSSLSLDGSAPATSDA
jgi:hypothetical protein